MSSPDVRITKMKENKINDFGYQTYIFWKMFNEIVISRLTPFKNEFICKQIQLLKIEMINENLKFSQS